MVTTVNENSTRDVEISFTDINDDPITPEQIIYSIIDLDSLEVIVEETEVKNKASTITITIQADENIILNSDNDYEDRIIMVRWFYGGGREENVNYQYRVLNLTGVNKEEYDTDGS